MTTDHQDARFWRDRVADYEGGINFGVCVGLWHLRPKELRRRRAQLETLSPDYSLEPYRQYRGGFWFADSSERATACAFLATLCEAGAFDHEGNLTMTVAKLLDQQETQK